MKRSGVANKKAQRLLGNIMPIEMVRTKEEERQPITA